MYGRHGEYVGSIPESQGEEACRWASDTPGAEDMNTASMPSLPLHFSFLKLAQSSQTGILDGGGDLAIGSLQAHIWQLSQQRGVPPFAVFKIKKSEWLGLETFLPLDQLIN